MARQAGYFNDKQTIQRTTKCPLVPRCYICKGERKEGTVLYLLEGEKKHTEK